MTLQQRFLLFTLMLSPLSAVKAVEFSGYIEGGYLHSQNSHSWLKSWMNGGVGVVRFNPDDHVKITQGVLDVSTDISDNVNLKLDANYYPDGDHHVGLSQAYLTYAPLSPGLKQQVRVGVFYPHMSLENIDAGWTSPYTYSFSAINTWFAEELRTVGAEWSITRRGRQYHSPNSFTFTAALYQSNDVLGAILSWRGWAMHNRQTLINEKLYFANYFQFHQFDKNLPAYSTITEETDGRWGYYAGLTWQYMLSTDVRLYYYDNNADQLAIEKNLQYAWDTRFISLAVHHRFTRQFRLLGQWLRGDTYMGTSVAGVFADYAAWYLMASYQWQQQRFSLRYDHFSVTQTDQHPSDPNDSHGHGLTLAWRYDLTPHWNIGAEWLLINSSNANRTLWKNWQAKASQQQSQLLVQYRF